MVVCHTRGTHFRFTEGCKWCPQPKRRSGQVHRDVHTFMWPYAQKIECSTSYSLFLRDLFIKAWNQIQELPQVSKIKSTISLS
jgi:hypothetical protein